MDFLDAEVELVFDANAAPQLNDTEAAGTAPPAAPEAPEAPEAPAPDEVEPQPTLAAPATAQASPSAAAATSVLVHETPSVIGQRFRSPLSNRHKHNHPP